MRYRARDRRYATTEERTIDRHDQLVDRYACVAVDVAGVARGKRRAAQSDGRATNDLADVDPVTAITVAGAFLRAHGAGGDREHGADHESQPRRAPLPHACGRLLIWLLRAVRFKHSFPPWSALLQHLRAAACKTNAASKPTRERGRPARALGRLHDAMCKRWAGTDRVSARNSRCTA